MHSTRVNKTGTSKVGAISTAQKAQNIFLEKNLKFSKKNSFGKCRTVPKNVKEGTLFDFQTCILLQNNEKLKSGTQKFSKKSRTVPEKNQKGGPFSLGRFCRLR